MSTQQELRGELLVWGRLEKECQIDNIPEDINNIILLFQKVCDLWDREYSNTDLEFDEDGSSVILKNDAWVTAYGQAVVKSDIYKWRIKIENLEQDQKYREGPYVVIIVDKVQYLKQYISSDGWDEDGYQLLAGLGNIAFCIGEQVEFESDCSWSKEGDILEITLDMNARTLMFVVNDDEDTAIICSNIMQSEYRLALTPGRLHGAKFVLL